MRRKKEPINASNSDNYGDCWNSAGCRKSGYVISGIKWADYVAVEVIDRYVCPIFYDCKWSVEMV